MLTYRSLVACTLSLFLLTACGEDFVELSADSSEPAEDEEEKKDIVQIGVSVEEEETAGLALLGGATTFSIQLDGCASGYTSTATEANPNLNAYKFDQNCLAKLTAFQVNGVDYEPQTDFTDWGVGDSATFADVTDPANTLKVLVIAQLSSPIDTADVITYKYAEIVEGTNAQVAGVGEGHVLTVEGQAAPDFEVSKLDFVSMTEGGAGQFVFALNCAVQTTGTGALTQCKDALLEDIEYKLVEGTDGADTLTMAEADSLFATAGTPVDTSTDVIAVGNAAAPNGGFFTTSGAAVLTGPDQMHLNPYMILVIKVGPSYKYYNIDVNQVSQ